MHRVIRALVVLSALLAFPLAAKNAYAGPITAFQIQWSSALYGAGSGIFIAIDDGGGQFHLTGILTGTGSQNGYSIALLPVGGYFGNDNLLFPGLPAVLDSGGFSFASSFADFNIWFKQVPSL